MSNYYLAVCYIDGTGTAKDHRKAADLLQEAMNSTQLNDMQKQMAQEMRDDLLNGVYGTDGSMNGQVNGGNVYQSGNSVSYRPDNNGNQKSEGCTLQPVYMVLMITRVSGYCEDSEIIIWRNINWADYLSEDIMR